MLVVVVVFVIFNFYKDICKMGIILLLLGRWLENEMK